MSFLKNIGQCLLATMQALAIVIGLILAGLCLPFYCLFTGTHMTAGMWEFSGLVVAFLICFFMAPWYTVIGGTVCAMIFGLLLAINGAFEAYMTSNQGMFETLPVMLFGFFFIGILWGTIRRIVFRQIKPTSY